MIPRPRWLPGEVQRAMLAFRWRVWRWRWWLPTINRSYGITHVWWGPFHAWEGEYRDAGIGRVSGMGWR